MSENWEDHDEVGLRPDPDFTPELFKAWRNPHFGQRNPERMNNPVWEWLIKSKVHAYTANEGFNGPDSLDAGPCWCFARFGQSSNELADGRTVLIGGEHEDFYDPDFYIYNDVVILHPDSSIDIFGYPREVFPPTDFHSATLAGDRIIVIGSLGYPEERRAGTTPVVVLDLSTFAMSKLPTAGTPPGWLHKHTATLSEDGTSILVRGGKVDRGRGLSLVENIDDWRLHIDGWRWERLTERRWRRWQTRRTDKRPNHLWQFQMAVFYSTLRDQSEFEKSTNELTRELGKSPDIELAKELYSPTVAHEKLPDKEDEHGVHRIIINGVVVRYVEESHFIEATVEGELPEAIVASLMSDLQQKLATLENTTCEREQI